MIKGVIMDNDGVIVDTEDLKLDVLNSILERHSSVIAREKYYKDYMGNGESEVVGRIIDEYRLPVNVQDFLELKRAAYHQLLMEQRDSLLLPFVPAFLRTMNAWNIPVAIATGSTRKELQALLPVIGAELISAAVTQDDVSRQKPSPEIFIAAAAKLGLKPQEVMILEDSWKALKAAKEIGFTTVLVSRHFSGPLDGIDYHFRSLGEFNYDLLKGGR